MEISFFRDACETLGRFASVRETAPIPLDRVVVQQIDGILKFIAGTDSMTVIVGAPGEGDDFRTVVSARMMLSAGKALKGKGTVTVSPKSGGALLRVSTGGEVRLPPIGSRVHPYVRPVLEGDKGRAPEGLLPSAVRRVTAVADGGGWMSQVVLGVQNGGVTIRAMDRHMYAEHPIDGLALTVEKAVPVLFMDALRGLDGASNVILSDKHVTVVSGPFTAVSVTLDAPVVPRQAIHPENSWVRTDRKQLIQMVKGASPHDEHNRVVLTASGASISVSPWGKDDSGMSLPAEVDGVGGSIGVTADYLLKLLNVIPATKAGLAWEAGTTGVIRVFGENDPWRQLLAPVAL